MCGRFTLRASPAKLVEIFQLLREPVWEPRYNIAPTQTVLAVRQAADSLVREGAAMRWGLIPSWAKEASIGSRMINARAETVTTKPAFRAAAKRRRCLIPADGFYEWARDGKQKLPYYIRFRDDEPFALAGLWETWTDPQGTDVESCTIITTEANPLLAELHDRMPVILDETDYDRWLDPRQQDARAVQDLLVPCPPERMEMYRVSPQVNSPRHESADCIAPLAGDAAGLFD